MAKNKARYVYGADGETITGILIPDVRALFAFIAKPREHGDFGVGTYSADLGVTDDATADLIEEYLDYVISAEENSKFRGKKPYVIKDGVKVISGKLKTPIREADLESDTEKDLIFKVHAKGYKQERPKLYINGKPITQEAFDTDERLYDEFYSGMYGEAIIQFWAYEFSGTIGISATLRAFNKTRDGVRIEGTKVSYDELFSEGTASTNTSKRRAAAPVNEFEEQVPAKRKAAPVIEEDEDDDEEEYTPQVRRHKQTRVAEQAPVKKATRRVVEEDEDDEEDEDINELLNTSASVKARPARPAAKAAATNIEDLL